MKERVNYLGHLADAHLSMKLLLDWCQLIRYPKVYTQLLKGTSKQTYIDSTQWNTGNLKLGVLMRLTNIMFTNFITNYKHATRYMTGKFSIYIFEILITVDNNMSRNINIKIQNNALVAT